MSSAQSALTMIGLDLLMVGYTLWVLSLRHPIGRLGVGIAVALVAWLAVLHLGLANTAIFPADISGPAFLAIIVLAVGAVGAMLWFVHPVRRLLGALDQQQLLLLQGVRVFFGASFLLAAAVGTLPRTFGILDGFTHVSAGFFGLIAAFALASGVDGARRAWFANLFGLADILIVASTVALVLLPEIGPHHAMMYAVFLPAPLWLWFHVVSLAGLTRGRVHAADPARAWSA